MPPDMSISMRRSKLKSEEAALLAGELVKPSWESRNEGIHERVNFEDAIWGFDLAGGAYYRTPLRVTFVKPESRAEKAGIRAGDRLLRINGIDTSTLTIQEAHEIIIKSGIHLTLTVTAPEDRFDAVYYYEDPLVEDPDEEELRRLEEEKARKRQVHAKVNHNWSLQWPWVSKRRIIWRESNCFMVPSKYEEKHRDKFPPLPSRRTTDDVVLFSAKDTSKNRVRGQKVPEYYRRDSKNFELNSSHNEENAKNRNVENGIDNIEEVTENVKGSDEESNERGFSEVSKGLTQTDETDEEDLVNNISSQNEAEDTLRNSQDHTNVNHDNDQGNSVSEDVHKTRDFNDLLDSEINNETSDNEVIEDILNSEKDKKDDDSNNVESIVGNGEHSSEKKLD